MRADIEKVQKELTSAIQKLQLIIELPEEVGAKVQWPHNSLIWERIGPDAWIPHIPNLEEGRTWPSEHIAGYPVKIIA